MLGDSYPARARRRAAARAAAPALALSVGLVGVASPAELEGIVAHELAHLRHRDVLVQTIAVDRRGGDRRGVARSAAALQRVRCSFVLGPVAAAFVHLLLSPKREFEADRFAAELCDSPHGLADALLRLEQAMELVGFEASPATEPLYTTNPFAEEGLAAAVRHASAGRRARAPAARRSTRTGARSCARPEPPARAAATRAPRRGLLKKWAASYSPGGLLPEYHRR